MNSSTEISSDTQLILDELRKFRKLLEASRVEASRCASVPWAKHDAVREASQGVLAPTQSEDVGVDIAADNWGGLFDGGDVSVPTQVAADEAVVVADNWGGLFDGGHGSDEEHGEARPILADNWDGLLFEQPAHVLEERNLASTGQIHIESCLAANLSACLPGGQAKQPTTLVPVPQLIERRTMVSFALVTPAMAPRVSRLADSPRASSRNIPFSGSIGAVEKTPVAQQEAERSGFLVARSERDRHVALVCALSAPHLPGRAPPRPPRLRRPRRAPPRLPWLCRPHSPRARGPRRAPPWRSRSLRRLIWRPPWRLASLDRRPRRHGHRVRGCSRRADPEDGDALRAGYLTERLDDGLCHTLPDFGLAKQGPVSDLTSVTAWGGTVPTSTATGGAEVSIALVAPARLSGSACVAYLSEKLSLNGTLHGLEYGVPAAAFLAKLRGGTCSSARPDLPEAAVRRTKHLLHCKDFAVELGREEAGLDVKLMGSVRYCATGNQLVIECKTLLDAQVVFDEMQQRYITNLISASWMGDVLSDGSAATPDDDQKVFEEMSAQITVLIEPLLAIEMSRPAGLQLWQQTRAMLLCLLAWPSFNSVVNSDLLSPRPIPWPSFGNSAAEYGFPNATSRLLFASELLEPRISWGGFLHSSAIAQPEPHMLHSISSYCITMDF